MIHPTAIIDPNADIADEVDIGPYTIIGADVVIGRGSKIGPHVVIEGPTRIGQDNRIFQYASIGAEPQDKKYAGEPTELIIGDRNVIRECCTFNRGTAQDKGQTVMGSDNWIMAYVHIAHDCMVGNSTIFANGATLAGHVTIHDYAILGGFTLVHQFCEVGEHAFTGMGASIGKDVIPWCMVAGNPTLPRGINQEGLKRRGFTPEQVKRIKEAYRVIYRQDLPLQEALTRIESELGEHADMQHLLDFCRRSQRGLLR